MRLTEVHWISAGQLDVLKEHNVETLEQLASFELRDSMADVVPIPTLRMWAKRARQELGGENPLSRIGAAAGAKYPVYAGGIKRGSD